MQARQIAIFHSYLGGKIQLGSITESSDACRMPTANHVRLVIKRALDAAGEGPMEAAVAMGIERNHIRDFLAGKKQSLKDEVRLLLCERYGLDFRELIISKEKRNRQK